MNINCHRKVCVILTIPILGRIVGFEELGNTDGFTTTLLERRLGQSGRTTYLENISHRHGVRYMEQY